MFALALWDAPRERLVLARDRARQEAAPLDAPARRHARVRLGAEGARSGSPALPRELDLGALDAYLALQYVPAPRTLLRGVAQAAAGSCARRRGRARERVERYWRAEARAEPGARDEEWLERVRETVRRRSGDASSPTSRSARCCRAGSTRASSSR